MIVFELLFALNIYFCYLYFLFLC